MVQPNTAVQWYKNNLPVLNAGAESNVYHVKQSGSYYAEVSNNEGCAVTTLKKNIIVDAPLPGITYPMKFTVTDVPVTLQARKIGVSARWSPSASLTDTTSFSPSFSSAADQVYRVAIKTATGCVTTDTQFVKIVSHVDIYVPTGFTPNKDGKNDILRPLMRGIKDFHYFKVFNRWGQLVFQTKNEFEGWDGLISGNAQQSQTVVWVVEGIGVDNQVYKKTGTTVLLR